MKKHVLPAVTLFIYGLFLIKVMVFKDIPPIKIGFLMLNFGGTDTGNQPNFVPFKTILPYLFGDKGWIIAGLNLVGNIVLLIPIGLLVPFIYRKISWKKTLVLAVASGLIIEVMQVILRVGIFDIDDVILNGLGVMIGYWTFIILSEWIRSKKYKTILITALTGVVALTGVIYAMTVDLNSQPRMNPGAGTSSNQTKPSENKEGTSPETGDLCGGTRGTGEIVSKGKNSITIERNDGVRQQFIITNETTIKTSNGTATETALKNGDRVTLVVYDDKTASAILVCNTKK